MRRFLIGTLALSLTAGPAAAQHRGGGGHPGGAHPGGGHMAAPAHHVGGTVNHNAGNFHMAHPTTVYRPGGVGLYAGGLYGGYGGLTTLGGTGLGLGGYGLRSGYYTGGLYGGGLYGGSRYYGSGGFVSGGYAPYYVTPQPSYVPPAGGVYLPPVPADPPTATALSGELPATLIVQFPAAARVWLDGVEVPGDADASWTFTSKDLKPGESATFRVRGRWEADGKTFEAVRDVPLGPGARSRLVVVSGNEVQP
jgi:uncharacterized protein (TIGR03000 family)